MVIIANSKDIKKYIINSKNCKACNITKGICVSKNGLVDFNVDLLKKHETCNNNCKFIITLKKISGSGVAYIKIDNFTKKVIVVNTYKIELYDSNNSLLIFREEDSIGDISIVNIECYLKSGENMSVVKNRKLINRNLYLQFNTDRKIDGQILPKNDFTTFKDEFIQSLYLIDESEFTIYGSKEGVINELLIKSNEIAENISTLNIPKCDYAVYHYAGIGDTIHSRLIVQQLAKLGDVVWIVPPIASKLYKDDNIATVMENFSIRFRNPFNKVCLELYSFVDKILKARYPKIINIGYDFFKYVVEKKEIDWKAGYFNCCGLVRDFNVKHELNHNGMLSELTNIPNKYVVIEHCSMSFSPVKLELYDELIVKLKTLGIECVYIGSISDPKLNEGIDLRGISLYDTYTLIKNSIGFIGRNSGNQTITVYCPDIPVFEVDVNRSLMESLYRDNIFSYKANNFVDLIYSFYKVKTIKDDKFYYKVSSKKVDEITLYNFAGKGDIINSTCIPRLVKNKYNLYIRICCRNRDKIFFENNPFVDEIYTIDDNDIIKKFAYKENKKWNNIGLWENEINTWGPSNGLSTINFSWSSSVGINRFFNEDLISSNDDLLPELFYTDNEIQKAEDFIKNNKPYVIIESECFSSQFANFQNILPELKNKIKNIDLKLYTSNITDKRKIIPPFYSLNDFNLKEIGLLINGCECFFGICSGMTVVSTERTLNRETKRLVHAHVRLPDFYFNKFKVQQIKVGTFTDSVANYINSYKN